MKIIQLIDNDFEDLELWYPVHRLREEGATVHLVGENAGEKYIGKYGVPAIADLSFNTIDYKSYDAFRYSDESTPVFRGKVPH